MGRSAAEQIRVFYEVLLDRYGPQHWWPAHTPFEVIVGAVLTQNTNWGNVERAIERLRQADALTPAAIDAMAPADLAERIRSAGYFNVKARRLKALVAWLVRDYDGDVERMRRVEPAAMRRQLLTVHGVGRETADSILLYALGHARFVVDAYTFRVAARHGLIDPFDSGGYDELQAVFEDRLGADAALFNEYHALLVRVGKEQCRPRARCAGCPLEEFPHDAEAV